MSRALAAYEPCGCCGAISVLGEDHETFGPAETAAAYKMAAAESKAGLRIENVDVDEWKARPMLCPEHKATHGPPWWKGNGGKGKRTDWKPPVEQAGLGL